MKSPIDTPFDDAQLKPSKGSSDLELNGGATLVKGDFEVNGQKVVVGIGLDPELLNLG